jgi:hypothetical protein
MLSVVEAVSKQYPGVAALLLCAIIAFNIGAVVTNFHYMRKNMATKKDLEATGLRIELKMAETYVRKEDCPALHGIGGKVVKGNGHGHVAGLGVV